MVRAAQGAVPPVWAAVAMGLALGLALLCKATTLFLWPVALLVAVLAYRGWRDRVVCGIGAMAVGLGVAAWFFLPRISAHFELINFAVLGGPSTWHTFSTSFLGQLPEPTLAYVWRVVAMLGESFWGQFGWSHLAIDRTALTAYWMMTAVALAAWWLGHRPLEFRLDRRALVVLGAAVAMFVVGVALAYAHLFMPQGGRYLLTIGSVIAIMLALGLLRACELFARILRRPISERPFAWGVVVLMVCLNWAVLWRSMYRAYAVAWGTG
jgi:hypothetical protein